MKSVEEHNTWLSDAMVEWQLNMCPWNAQGLGDPLAPSNVATPKYQIWVSLFPGGNFLAKFSYKFLHRWSCTQTAQIALEYYSHTMGSGRQFNDDFS